MERPRGEAEWREKRNEITARIAELERQMGPAFREWEQLGQDLLEWDRMQPNAPESPHS